MAQQCYGLATRYAVITKTEYNYTDYFMESARVRYLRTSCWRIRKRTSERSERVSFLIQKQRVRKYRTKHFPCYNLFILYLLRFFNPNQIFTLHLIGRSNIKLCFHSVRVQARRFFKS